MKDKRIIFESLSNLQLLIKLITSFMLLYIFCLLAALNTQKIADTLFSSNSVCCWKISKIAFISSLFCATALYKTLPRKVLPDRSKSNLFFLHKVNMFSTSLTSSMVMSSSPSSIFLFNLTNFSLIFLIFSSSISSECTSSVSTDSSTSCVSSDTSYKESSSISDFFTSFDTGFSGTTG